MQGLATFPGIGEVVSCTMSLSHGITPSVASLRIAPQGRISGRVGALEFSFGNQKISFKNCLIDDSSLETTTGGQITQLKILDRRWRWTDGAISGRYNLRYSDAGDNLVLGTAKSPRQLAELCLDAMGETDYDVSELPNLARPLIEWDYEVPARALAALCDLLGCRVVLGIDDKVSVRKLGQGKSLPLDDDAESVQTTRDPPRKPDQLVIVTAPERWQADLRLEAVALDDNNAIVRLDDVSYKPSGGWGAIDIDHFNGLAEPRERELARQSVFRWYRIKTPIELPPLDAIKYRVLIDLRGAQVEVRRQSDGSLEPLPPYCYGVWTSWPSSTGNRQAALARIGAAPTRRETPAAAVALAGRLTAADRFALVDVPFDVEGSRLPENYRGLSPAAIDEVSFSIDADRRLIKFSAPVVQFDSASGQFQAAEIVLRTAVSVRDAKTRQPLRKEYTRRLTQRRGADVLGRYVIRDDIDPWRIVDYDSGLRPKGTKLDNHDFCKEQAEHYLDELEAEYETLDTASITWRGLKRIQPDGAVQQVVWTVGVSGGCTTQASYNDELPSIGISFKERRRRERISDLLAARWRA